MANQVEVAKRKRRLIIQIIDVMVVVGLFGNVTVMITATTKMIRSTQTTRMDIMNMILKQEKVFIISQIVGEQDLRELL